jgi:hypothetical protein
VAPFRIEYDRDYGIDRRSGWTVIIGGRVIVELYRSLIGALCIAAWKWMRGY